MANRLEKSTTLAMWGHDVFVPTHLCGLFKVLTNIIRNSVDHGLESHESRGDKPEVGAVFVDVTATDERMTIMVKDEGKELDRVAISQKAVARGILDCA